jgi:L-malate glycosyltransferase
MEYVNQSHWDDSYRELKFSVSSDRVTKWLDCQISYDNKSGNGSAFELGFFPARYLAHLGGKGYEVNGCDLTPRTADAEKWLTNIGLKVGEIVNSDAISYTPKRLYDIVYSIGFIEHFEDFVTVIRAHDRYLKPGGLLILSVPNFSGRLQRMLHSVFDRKNFELHNLAAMDLSVWQRTLLEMNYTICYSGYFGGYDFWVDNRSRKFSILRDTIAFFFRALGRYGALAPNSPSWSPYLGMVARKARG